MSDTHDPNVQPSDELGSLKSKILNEGSLPRRSLLIDNLIEEATMQGYKRGFKEAEAYIAAETNKAKRQVIEWIMEHDTTEDNETIYTIKQDDLNKLLIDSLDANIAKLVKVQQAGGNTDV